MNEQISIFDLLQQTDRFTDALKIGSLISEGKFRIFVAANLLPVKELAVFLKEEHGISGCSITFSDGRSGFVDYRPAGIMLSEFRSEWQEKHSWSEASRRIKQMIISNDYLTQKERASVASVIRGHENTVPIPRTGW